MLVKRNARNSLSLEDRNVNDLYEEEHTAAEIARYFTDIFASLGADCTAVVERALLPCISQD